MHACTVVEVVLAAAAALSTAASLVALATAAGHVRTSPTLVDLLYSAYKYTVQSTRRVAATDRRYVCRVTSHGASPVEVMLAMASAVVKESPSVPQEITKLSVSLKRCPRSITITIQ